MQYGCTTAKTVSNPAIEAKIKSWLRQATDRDGGRRRHFLVAEKRHLLRRTSLLSRLLYTAAESGSAELDGVLH